MPEIQLKARGLYAFKSVVFSHGWSDLPPFCVRKTNGEMDLALRAGGRPLRLTLRPAPNGVLVESAEQLPDAALKDLRWMFRLDDDLTGIYALLRKEGRPWAAKHRMGRLLRSQTVFEDVVKLILTTNCSWSLTRLMADRLSEALGAETADGYFLFPTAEAMAGKNEKFYREIIRAGYRSPNLARVGKLFASGQVDSTRWLEASRPSGEIRKEILALPGAGPYVADNMLRLLGRHDRLGLDSWARGKLKDLWKMKKVPSDTTIERRYKLYGDLKGLVLWCDLTHDWFTTDRFKDWIRTEAAR